MKIEDLKNTKIYLHFKEDRIKFKNKLEKLGIKWKFWSTCDPIIQDDIPFIYINEDLELYMDYEKNFSSFCSVRNKQIFIEDILSIKDPKEDYNFKPYDRVLVRLDNDERWRPREFSWYDIKNIYGMPYETTDGSFYRQCIPYDENLVNTRDPE